MGLSEALKDIYASMRAETHSTDLLEWATNYALHSCNPAVHPPICEQQSNCSSCPFTSTGFIYVWCYWDVNQLALLEGWIQLLHAAASGDYAAGVHPVKLVNTCQCTVMNEQSSFLLTTSHPAIVILTC